LNTKSANVLENPLKKIYYYEITKLIGMGIPAQVVNKNPAHAAKQRVQDFFCQEFFPKFVNAAECLIVLTF
jgi:hypothetical protein